MEHQQDENAVAYVIYERVKIWLKEEGPTAPWSRVLLFHAEDHAFNRDQMWEREVTWRDPKNIRVVPLYDEDANDAKREANLDAINARYEAAMADKDSHSSLGDAVEWALEKSPPELDEFENLIKTLEAFEYMVQEPLSAPPHTIERADWAPSFSEIETFQDAEDGGGKFARDDDENPADRAYRMLVAEDVVEN